MHPVLKKGHLQNWLGVFVKDKINKIRNTFRNRTSMCVPSEKKPQSFRSFHLVSESEVLK